MATPDLKTISGVTQNVSLKTFNWWKVGGEAEYYCRPKTFDQLKEQYMWANAQNLEVTILSSGSNVLISDKGISGLLIHLDEYSEVLEVNEAERLSVVCLSGTGKSEVLKEYLRRNLAPALFLTGLPGDMGAGVVMNAGVGESREPREFCEITDWIEVLKPDGSVVRLTNEQIKWSYRHSEGWQPGIITKLSVSWPMESVDGLMKLVREATKARIQKQPLNQPSCGSTFRNPEGHKSGQLIEQSGLKGFEIGGAQVSEKHANFLINTGEATASDIASLIQHVQLTVKDKFGVDLETEIKKLGNWDK